jgi:hypothetical protein
VIIRITKKGSRNVLVCVRPDGSTAAADLGPSLPYHDLAHFVVERVFGLEDGFFGNVARGFTPAQLSDKEIIRSLGAAPYRAEILARALGSMATGACAPDQFEELVNAELAGLALSTMCISPATRDALLVEFKGYMDRYSGLQDGESMTLQFELPGFNVSRSNSSLQPGCDS